MKKYLLSIALISIMSLEISAHVDHYSKYNYLEYELFRNNKSIPSLVILKLTSL